MRAGALLRKMQEPEYMLRKVRDELVAEHVSDIDVLMLMTQFRLSLIAVAVHTRLDQLEPRCPHYRPYRHNCAPCRRVV